MIKPLSGDEARDLIWVCRIGRLGCVYQDRPYVVPVNYVFDGDSVYIHSMPGRKIFALRANPKACLQVDDVADDYHWKSAIAYGTYSEVTEPSECKRASEMLLRRFPQLTPVESVPVHDGQSSVIIFRIKVEEVTGIAER